jgi:Co/Zn/Cd efflux system component
VKGVFMLLFGLGVCGEALHKMLYPIMPGVETMGAIGGLALVANLVCFFLLYQHRSDNLNMRSTWLCSRNDLMANAGVLAAAACSALLTSSWPDIIVGMLIAGVFLRSAWHVVQQSRQAMRQPLHVLTIPHV